MTQAITTKYLGATETKGSRIKATCDRGSITISYPYELSHEDVYIKAANALVQKFVIEDKITYPKSDPWMNPWAKPFVTGSTKNGCVHVFTNDIESEIDFITRVDPLQILDGVA